MGYMRQRLASIQPELDGLTTSMQKKNEEAGEKESNSFISTNELNLKHRQRTT
jgi:hypothetical protein